VEEVAEVYARALFEVAQERGQLDVIREQLAQFVEALDTDRNLGSFFFSPSFSPDEKKDGLGRMLEGAEATFLSFLETLIERHRMPELFRIRTHYEEFWEKEMKLLPVEVTSAVELDAAVVAEIGDRIRTQTGNNIELTSVVDPDILGGIVLRVGDFILDASIRNSLSQLRKQVAHAARAPVSVKEPLNADQA
jgi:F-type H+-transporting ATPase subunit delta